MTVQHATDADFSAILTDTTKPVLVDFYATWCGPCRQVAPILDQIAAEHGDKFKIVKVDIDQAPAVAQRYGVMSVPTLVVHDPTGQPVQQFTGPQPKPVLVTALDAAA